MSSEDFECYTNVPEGPVWELWEDAETEFAVMAEVCDEL